MWALIPPVLYALSRSRRYVEAYVDLMKTTKMLTGEEPLGLKDVLNKLKSYVKKVGVPVEYRERILENLREIKKSLEEANKPAAESVRVIGDTLMASPTLTLYSEVEMALPSALGYSENNAESFLDRHYQNIKNSIDELEGMLRNDSNEYPAVFNFDRVLRNIKYHSMGIFKEAFSKDPPLRNLEEGSYLKILERELGVFDFSRIPETIYSLREAKEKMEEIMEKIEKIGKKGKEKDIFSLIFY